MEPSDATIRQVLETTRRSAVVGASNKPARPSFGVMRYLLARGYEVVPVNPGLAGQEIRGLRSSGPAAGLSRGRGWGSRGNTTPAYFAKRWGCAKLRQKQRGKSWIA